MKICGFEKCLEERKLTYIWKWKALNSTESFVTHLLIDFIHGTDDYFSESHGAHLFTVKKPGKWAKTSFPHLMVMCYQQKFNSCETRDNGFFGNLCLTRSHWEIFFQLAIMLQYHFPCSAMQFWSWYEHNNKNNSHLPETQEHYSHSIFTQLYKKAFFSLFNVNNFHILVQINIKLKMNCQCLQTRLKAFQCWIKRQVFVSHWKGKAEQICC